MTVSKAKPAEALIALAMRWAFSRVDMALPSLLATPHMSWARRFAVGLPDSARAV